MIENVPQGIKTEVFEYVNGSATPDLGYVAEKLGVAPGDVPLALKELDLEECEKCGWWGELYNFGMSDEGEYCCEECLGA